MNTELEKISFYFDEAIRQSKVDSSFSVDRKFYELWENIHCPRPFVCDGNEITLADSTFKTVNESISKKACFAWDEPEACASLVIEGREWLDKILIFIDEGETFFTQQEPVFLEEMGLSYGERLEVVFDVIAYLREHNTQLDIFNLKKDEFLSVIDALQEQYGSVVLSVMKKLSMASVRRLIKKASEDMPKDELSNQLHLPLDGSYVAPSKEEVPEPEEKVNKRTHERLSQIPGRTKWEVVRDLELLRDAAKFAFESEKTYIVPFKDAELLAEENNFRTFKVPVPLDVPLQEGDILGVFLRGEDADIGTFRVDIYDTDVVYGRIRFYDNPEKKNCNTDRLYAKPTRSPIRFLAEGMENLFQEFNKDVVLPILRQLTGLVDSSFVDRVVDEDGSEEMDDSQKQAWSCALEDENPVVLVQGPPGTGKTKVLVEVIKSLCQTGKRILVTAPSNTAVDNICRKVFGFPVLRFGKNKRSISPDVVAKCWIGEEVHVTRFVDQRKETGGGGIYAGTHVGLLKDGIIRDDMRNNGPYDVIVFDEAGMAAVSEFLLLAEMSKRVVLFGDHKQLPPFPLPKKVLTRLDEEIGPRLSDQGKFLISSALEWLADVRHFPVLLLKKSYRCQNPRLLRFSSILFYDALVTASEKAEYFSLPYHERIAKYPANSLQLISTSKLPEEIREEKLVFEGGKPGLENHAETVICIHTVCEMLRKYPLNEITVIAPYKRQVRLMREVFSKEKAEAAYGKKISDKQWENFLYTRISTVDSFQGGESDAVIISYVRSNKKGGIGFVDDANRINVAHTRCRREMIIVGDIECLKKQAVNDIFRRLERTVSRDGEFISLNLKEFKEMNRSGFFLPEETPKQIAVKTAEPIPVPEEKKEEVMQVVLEPEKSIKVAKKENDSEPSKLEQVSSITEPAEEPPDLIGMEQPDLF